MLPSLQRLKHVFSGLLLCIPLWASAAPEAAPPPLPAPLEQAMKGNSFAAATSTVSSPYGGSYSIDASAWSGNSGTISVSYNNFKLPPPYSFLFNGNWTFTGSIAANSLITGTLTGIWSISGLTGLPGPVSCNMTMNFSGGQALVTMVINVAGQSVTQNFQFSQAVALGLLL